MPFYGMFDSTIIILVPAFLIALFAQFAVKSAYSKYSKIHNLSGYTGEQVARKLLNEAGLYNVPIEIINQKLGDHYDPRGRVLRLSTEVYSSNTIAAAGIAAHEVGHAIQHSKEYTPLIIRNTIAPSVNWASNLSWVLFMAGFLFSFRPLVSIGIIFFSAVVLFQVVTLPVEFNASSRALKLLNGILYQDEIVGAKKVLTAAALTYVAAALTSILELIRLIVLSNRND